MKLYLAPTACSFTSHIVLRELGLPFELESVNFGTKKTRSGEDFKAINPKGKVPALKLDDGQVLTEGSVIVQYLADQKPEAGLLPKAGTFERIRVQEWLNFIATEVHKGFSPLFKPNTPDETKKAYKDLIAQAWDFVSKKLGDKPFLTGNDFSVADAYLFNMLQWNKTKGGEELDLAKWPVLQAFEARVATRPAVRAAVEAEAALR
ncbi:MAG TPA: glutathione transferase GstA [Polyangiaceae bacterium]|nr:glutathione transferase GstA [Polyangiaceae bacterium]